MSFAFVCAKGDENDEDHSTTGAMVQCAFCGKFAVGGYFCNDCDHEDIDAPDGLSGHGAGKCPGDA
jgi:hypothetical protein